MQDQAPHSMMETLMALDACTPTTLVCHKGEWSRITSTPKPHVREKALDPHPDQNLARFICSGIRYGFRIGFNYRTCSYKPVKGNMKSVRLPRDVVEQYLVEEKWKDYSNQRHSHVSRSVLLESFRNMSQGDGAFCHLQEEVVWMTA